MALVVPREFVDDCLVDKRIPAMNSPNFETGRPFLDLPCLRGLQAAKLPESSALHQPSPPSRVPVLIRLGRLDDPLERDQILEQREHEIVVLDRHGAWKTDVFRSAASERSIVIDQDGFAGID